MQKRLLKDNFLLALLTLFYAFAQCMYSCLLNKIKKSCSRLSLVEEYTLPIYIGHYKCTA